MGEYDATKQTIVGMIQSYLARKPVAVCGVATSSVIATAYLLQLLGYAALRILATPWLRLFRRSHLTSSFTELFVLVGHTALLCHNLFSRMPPLNYL
jgi:hypothetical protein